MMKSSISDEQREAHAINPLDENEDNRSRIIGI